MKAHLIYILILALVTSSYAAIAPCQSGRYCFADSVYTCIDGQPQLIEKCTYKCTGEECVNAPLEPDITYQQTKTPELTRSNDMILIITTIIIVLAFAFLLIFQLRLKRKDKGS